MPQKNFGLLGLRKSIPKLTKINGDDNAKVIYRNLGNNHAYPFVWADTFTVASGITSTVLASGIKFHGYDLSTYGTVVVTPNWNAGNTYVTADTSLNTITFHCTTAGANNGSSRVKAMFMLGEDPELEGMYCRGFGSLPLPGGIV
jgi:hypothetical protein